MAVNLHDLEEQLTKLPGQIRDAGIAYLESKDKVENAKLRLDVAISMATLKSQESNATRQKAEALIATQEEKKELLIAQLEESKAENTLKYLENRYISMRKISSLEQEQMRSNISGN